MTLPLLRYAHRPTISLGLRDNNFDALRLIFSSMVVVFHMGLLSQAPSLGWTSNVSATFAVQAFFVVSGFLVTMSFENSSSLKAYAMKRIRRIAPAYVAVVVTAALSLSALSSLPFLEYFKHSDFRRYLLFNLALSNFSAPSLPGVFQSNFVTAVNGSLWTIKIEVAFYCIVPMIVLAGRRFGTSKILVTLFVSSILWKVGFNALAMLSGTEIYTKLAKQLPGQLSFFIGGIWAFYRTRDNKGIGIGLAIAGLMAYALISEEFLTDVAAPLAVTAIVYWAAIMAPKLPRVAARGDFSYGAYLYHFPIIQTLVALGLFQLSVPTAVLILFLVLGLAAFLSWHFLESRFVHRAVKTRSTTT